MDSEQLSAQARAELDAERQQAVERAREAGLRVETPAAAAGDANGAAEAPAAPAAGTDAPQMTAGLPGEVTSAATDAAAAASDAAGGPVGTELQVGGRSYDVADLTLAEIEVFEEVQGCGFSEADFGRIRTMRVMLWLLGRRDDPAYTVEQAGQITLRDLTSAREQAEQLQGNLADTAAPASEAAGQARERLESLERQADEPGDDAGPDPTTPPAHGGSSG